MFMQMEKQKMWMIYYEGVIEIAPIPTIEEFNSGVLGK